MLGEIQNNEELKKILLENQRLLIENNELLRKMRRASVFSGIFKIVWFAVIVLIPIYIFYTYIQPNLSILEEKMELIEQLSGETPDIKAWYDSVKPKP